MTERETQIREVLARSVRQIEEKDTRSWYLRLWISARTVEDSDHKADLLYHEALTYIAERNSGWVGRTQAIAVIEK